MTRVLIAVAALIAALALPSTAGSTSSKTLVTTNVSGGFAGVNTTTTINGDGRGVVKDRTGKTQRFRVPSDELSALRRRLKDAHFETLGNYPVPPGSADFIETRITYAGKTVDASYRIPKRLKRALQAVDDAVNAGLPNSR
jgi:hypothetical protein